MVRMVFSVALGVIVLFAGTARSASPSTAEAPSSAAQAGGFTHEESEAMRAALEASVTAAMEARLPAEALETYRALAERNRELLLRRRQLEYEDPIASGLKEKLVSAEKEVVALRLSLQARIDAIEEIQAIEAERAELMKQIQQLKKEARAVETDGQEAEE